MTKARATLSVAGALTASGLDAEAVNSQCKDDFFFDLSLGHNGNRLCIHPIEAELLVPLNALCGSSWCAVQPLQDEVGKIGFNIFGRGAAVQVAVPDSPHQLKQ
ncbi:hypothetical protein [Methyloceanibacter stevinii]|uniref:hypothetical protein n=1 Tax=Methyloceanibacter stevinii TaxID=1774970 RepID=UPI000849B136